MRAPCLQAIRQLRPELAAFTELFHSRPSFYWYRDSRGHLWNVSTEEGVEQGDGFAPALFAYGLKEVLAAAQRKLDDFCNEHALPKFGSSLTWMTLSL